MDDKQLADLLKYSSPNELWIVTWNNLLKVLITPFKVCVKDNIGLLKKGQIVWVEQVKITRELKTVFIIKGQAYYCHHFDLLDEDG
tara:strand:- start:38 stop:295 length:258 start_codon:yes stop_codon:yes gene_type:complete